VGFSILCFEEFIFFLNCDKLKKINHYVKITFSVLKILWRGGVGRGRWSRGKERGKRWGERLGEGEGEGKNHYYIYLLTSHIYSQNF
jgi:hypothetical protein